MHAIDLFLVHHGCFFQYLAMTVEKMIGTQIYLKHYWWCKHGCHLY